ncbi:MAG: MFS transporter [Thermomicrobiales bacterium]
MFQFRRRFPRKNNQTGIAASTPRPGEKRDRFIAFQYRNYRLYFVGQLISVIGTWMQSTSEAWMVVDLLHASPLQLAFVAVCQFGPVLFFGIPAGILSDRFPKRRILLMTQSVFGTLALIMMTLIATGVVQLWHVYALALIYGINMAIDQPARQAFVSEMVGKEAVMNAVSLNSAVFNAGRIVGPAVAGALLAVFGPAVCFGINGASYIAVLIGLSMMQVTPQIRRMTGSALAGIREGLAYVRATPDIRRTILLIGFIGIFAVNFNVWVPLLAQDDFKAGAGTYGLLMASMGVGSLTGALSLAMFGGRKPNRKRMLLGAMGLGLAEVALAYVASVPLPVVVGMISLAMIGFLSSNTMATANTIVQTTASDEYRGRVMAVYMTVFSGTTPIGALAAGAIAEHFSTPASVAVGGGVAFLAAATIAWSQRDRLGSRDVRSAIGPAGD